MIQLYVSLIEIKTYYDSEMVPGAGIEPARPLSRGILNPLRLPISPSGHFVRMDYYSSFFRRCQHVVLVLAVAFGSCLTRHSSILLIVYQFRHPGIVGMDYFCTVFFN